MNTRETKNQPAVSAAASAAMPKQPTRHAKIMRGVVAPLFGLLAVTCLVLGALNATVWKPSTQVNATASVTPSGYVITDPGVLALLDPDAELTVALAGDAPAQSAAASNTAASNTAAQGTTSQGAAASARTLCVALGSSKDAVGWASGRAYTRITGLQDWHHLATQRMDGAKPAVSVPSAGASARAAAGAAAPEVAFDAADMWTSVRCGEGRVTLASHQTAAAATAAVGSDAGASSRADAAGAAGTADAAGANRSALAAQASRETVAIIAFPDAIAATNAAASGATANTSSASNATSAANSANTASGANSSSDAKRDATIALHWVRDTVPDFATPLYFVGGLFIIMTILAASLFAIMPIKRRHPSVIKAWTRKRKLATAASALTGATGDAESASDSANAAANSDAHEGNIIAAAIQETSDGSSRLAALADDTSNAADAARAALAQEQLDVEDEDERSPEEVSVAEALTGSLKNLRAAMTFTHKRHKHAAPEAENSPDAAQQSDAANAADAASVATHTHNGDDTARDETSHENTTHKDITHENAGSERDTATESASNASNAPHSETTTVISAEEFQAYFARFTQEESTQDTEQKQ